LSQCLVLDIFESELHGPFGSLAIWLEVNEGSFGFDVVWDSSGDGWANRIAVDFVLWSEFVLASLLRLFGFFRLLWLLTQHRLLVLLDGFTLCRWLLSRHSWFGWFILLLGFFLFFVLFLNHRLDRPGIQHSRRPILPQ
jgi:hypothetical protein